MTAPLSPPEQADLARLLPATVREKLIDEVRDATRITRRVAIGIDGQYAISETYRVTIEQLQGYLRRLRKRSSASAKDPGQIGRSREKRKPTRERRERQAEIAKVLQRLFGDLADLEPGLWSHRAFLMLMGLVYEKLAISEQELSIDELVRLTKALGDACRVRPRAKSDRTAGGSTSSRGGALPNHFADIVREVYGTNFDARVGVDEQERGTRRGTTG